MVWLIGYDQRKTKEGKIYFIEYLKYTADITDGECVAQVFNSESRHDKLFGGISPGMKVPGLKIGWDKEKNQNFVYSIY